MMGVLQINRKNQIFLNDTAEHKKVNLISGQYIYFKVQNSWIPVVVKYSQESGRWCFCHMENINVNGQTAMIRNFYEPSLPEDQTEN